MKKAICFICKNETKGDLVNFSKSAENDFTTVRFCNWRNAYKAFKKHQGSDAHKEAQKKCIALNKDSVMPLVNNKERDNQHQRQHNLTQISVFRMLLRQCMAVRGRTEPVGNLQQLLILRTEDVPDLSSWLADGNYLSHDIVNELITLMGNQLFRTLLEDIREAGYFSIMAGETRNLSNIQQLVICIRWVDQKLCVHEDPLGFVSLPSTDAKSITDAIKYVLFQSMLPLIVCR